MNEAGRILGIDHGMKRVGVAVSDPMGIIAQGIDTLQNDSRLADRIVDIVKRMSVRTIVVGRPLKLNGLEGDAAVNAAAFAVRLRRKLEQEKLGSIEVVEWDERFTTTMAQRTQIEMGIRKKQRQEKSNLDRMASQLILQSYLDAHPGVGSEKRKEA